MRIGGRVTDEAGEPLVALVVTLHQAPPRIADPGLARATTDADGAFSITDTAARGHVLAVRDAAGVRVLLEVPLEDAETGNLALTIVRAQAEGWLATLGEGAPARLTEGNHVEIVPEGEGMARVVLDLVKDAKRSIRLSQLLFKPGFHTTGDDGEEDLLPALADAERRGVDVRVLLNRNAVIPDDTKAMRRALADAGVDADPVLRGVLMTFNVFHAKMLVVDDEDALLLGAPFQQRFWDTAAHPFNEPRRAHDQPMHFVSVRVRGPVVPFFTATFAEVWNRDDVGARFGTLGTGPRPAPQGPAPVQFLRTLPPGFAPDGKVGERGILEAYLRAFAHAERLVYLEHQYFTSPVVTRVLEHLLERRPDLEVILVANEHVDIPTYDQWQAAQVERLREHPRFGAFSLWVPGPDPEAGGRERVRPVYVHSKVAVVDDAWVTLGNANLDGASLHAAHELGRPDKRNLEVNLAVPDGVARAPRTGFAGEVRRRLWSEHLDLPEGALRDPPAPGSWLTLWRERAEANRIAAAEGAFDRLRGRPMPLDPGLPDERVRPPPLVYSND